VGEVAGKLLSASKQSVRQHLSKSSTQRRPVAGCGVVWMGYAGVGTLHALAAGRPRIVATSPLTVRIAKHVPLKVLCGLWCAVCPAVSLQACDHVGSGRCPRRLHH
jgi:hypothetical protein